MTDLGNTTHTNKSNMYKDGMKQQNKVFKKQVVDYFGSVQSDGSIKSESKTYFYTAIEDGSTNYFIVKGPHGSRLGNKWTLRLILDMGFTQVE